jgi:hypothetical protein
LTVLFFSVLDELGLAYAAVVGGAEGLAVLAIRE